MTEVEKGIDLDDLENEVEKLLALLQDRHPGMITWNEFLLTRIKNLHALTSQVLGR